MVSNILIKSGFRLSFLKYVSGYKLSFDSFSFDIYKFRSFLALVLFLNAKCGAVATGAAIREDIYPLRFKTLFKRQMVFQLLTRFLVFLFL